MTVTGNGIRFTQSFGKLDIEIKAMKVEDNNVQLMVIPKTDQPMKFSGIVTEASYREFIEFCKKAPLVLKAGLQTNTNQLAANLAQLLG